ncbi:endonuclease/exonuclease/phosphatase family protein [Subtercola vilae]|uniref:Endonuclease n=1 Tax=Subtercola vilae TaxID=2056433 RepID=A0A4T2C425_9MICO|nr:endonuclease/exonuclease/phosphatase family protein [Subtercola vilae]TIH38282.1 endonuclease [Subtercola vilae]
MSLLSSPTRPTPVEPLERASGRRPGHPALAAVVVALAVFLTLILVFHRAIPDVGGVGLIIDTIIPWLGLLIVPLAVLGLVARRRWSRAAVLVPVFAWALLFGSATVPLSWSAPAANTAAGTTLTVASQNIEASSSTGDESALTLAATGADVIALEEMTAPDFTTVSSTLAEKYPYSFGVGTVGLWSKYPVVHAQPLPLGLGWNRALAADLETPQGLVSIYVIHAASARPGEVSDRDSMLSALAETLPRDENQRVIAVGDFNAALTDRAMSGIEGQLSEANQSGGLFGNTWPSNMPVTRLDHLLQRGMQVTSNTTLSAGASDHRAILTALNL